MTALVMLWVVPAKAGTQGADITASGLWMPAVAGMTGREWE